MFCWECIVTSGVKCLALTFVHQPSNVRVGVKYEEEKPTTSSQYFKRRRQFSGDINVKIVLFCLHISELTAFGKSKDTVAISFVLFANVS